MPDISAISASVKRATSGKDPASGLAALRELRIQIEELQDTQVASARAAGCSWRLIADALGVSKQAVHKRYASRLAAPLPNARP